MTKSYQQKLAAARARTARAEADALDAKIRLAITRHELQRLSVERNQRLTRNVWFTASHVARHDEAAKLQIAEQLLNDPALIPLSPSLIPAPGVFHPQAGPHERFGWFGPVLKLRRPPMNLNELDSNQPRQIEVSSPEFLDVCAELRRRGCVILGMVTKHPGRLTA